MHQDVEVFFERRALLERIDTDHRRVDRQRAGADAQHGSTACQVVEQQHPVGDPQRVVVGQ